MEANQSKAKIGVGFFVIENVKEMKESTSEGRSGRISKEVVGSIQAVVGGNKFLNKFKEG